MITVKEKRTFKIPTRDNVAPVNQGNFDALNRALGFVPHLYATIGYFKNGLSRFLAYQGTKTSLFNKEMKR